ncbi:sugar ABC transporter permease [Paenibacillus sp. J5C_2022]|uniref:carbohydrate ABC transporter permease n=1 Tax=Paenibacillus sp. J5C2022 TaxID=2977129 RepID=UPI0021D19344|nr:sugar ABC transporter permease [Paenibacillus sp. J5C2022]MCU6708816.1 sugar ABC transporter permease [Paenibacillus sp. J5C2022]
MMKKRQLKETLTGYLFVLPNLIGFGVFTCFGVLFSLTVSFTDWDMLSPLSEIRFVGLTNFLSAFQDPWFLSSISNNLFFILFIPLQMLLALGSAVLLNGKFPGNLLVRNTIYLPYITSFVGISLIWFQLFHPTMGVLNEFLMFLGIDNPPKWLGSSTWVKPAIILMLTWQGLGYNMLLYLAGLQSVPKEMYEAASVDGASGFRQFVYITIPMTSSVSFFILIISVINSFMMWSNIQIMTGGGPGTASTVIGFYIYKTAFVHTQMGYASAMAWMLFLIILIITLVQWYGQKKWVNY